MAEQTTTNSIHPQDGNQIVIGENHATITINNHNKTNDKILDSIIESDKMSSKNISDFIVEMSKIANKIIELEQFKRRHEKRKRKSK